MSPSANELLQQSGNKPVEVSFRGGMFGGEKCHETVGTLFRNSGKPKVKIWPRGCSREGLVFEVADPKEDLFTRRF